jgi:3',5'-cyclic AMP phosphodiesterase CpdA
VDVTRVAVVSDSHLSARAPEAERNWSAVVDYVRATEPDLVVHVGDLSLDGERVADDLVYARTQLDRLPAPWLAVPGNHDIGDVPGLYGDPADAVDAERLRCWREVVGPDRWDAQVGGWRFVGVNAQLFGSGLPAEDEQWAWLEARFADDAAPGRTVPHAVFITHKPLAATDDELAAAPRYRFVPAPARARVLSMLPRAHVGLVLSGHVHQYRSSAVGGTSHVWAPTTWTVLPEEMQPTIGVKRCGLVDVELAADGVVAHRLVEPPGLVQLSLGDEVPNPYAH